MLSARTTGRCLSTEKSSRALNYLDAWVGTSSASETRSASPRPKSQLQNQHPLLLSGSSYLMPTLRIERKDTPESISTRIAAALEDSFPGATIKTMLRGKPTSGVARWHVPLVLDLSALVPDGSPHYTPPQRGLLAGLVKVLQEYGIRVVGVTNTPAILEEEAVLQLGLPSFMSKGRVLDRGTSKVPVEDVIQMLIARSLESGYDEIDLCDRRNSAIGQ